MVAGCINHQLLGVFMLLDYPKAFHVSNEKIPGCLVYIGGEKLPSYIGIIINH